jgi:hypothetical protein
MCGVAGCHPGLARKSRWGEGEWMTAGARRGDRAKLLVSLQRRPIDSDDFRDSHFSSSCSLVQLHLWRKIRFREGSAGVAAAFNQSWTSALLSRSATLYIVVFVTQLGCTTAQQGPVRGTSRKPVSVMLTELSFEDCRDLWHL